MTCAGKNKENMNLKEMYRLKMTPERMVEAFRRFVIKLKQQKYFGRQLDYRDYQRGDPTLFREEALYLKDLDAEYDRNVRLTQEIRCLEEMTDEQILRYRTLVKDFRKNTAEQADMAYARYYMLEIVNLIYQDTASEAFEVLFSFWDALDDRMKLDGVGTEYFYQLCQLFMLAHQELIPRMMEELEQRSGRDLSGQALVRIEAGDYEQAAKFVIQNARLLKKEDIESDAVYIRRTWEAMPFVFEQLSARLADYDFPRRVLDGFYASAYIGDYFVKGADEEHRKMVTVSKYVYYEYQEYSAYWKYWYYVLRESVQDFLSVVRQYTQYYVRKYSGTGRGKCTASRFLKKSYERGADRTPDVERLKAMVSDERFETAVQEGVLLYFTEKKIPLPEKKKRGPAKPTAQAIDYGETEVPAVVDQERLQKARKDADLVLGMLSEGEIDYEGGKEEPPEPTLPAVSAGSWEPEEIAYLGFLRAGNRTGAEAYLGSLGMPENRMMKAINEKALTMMEDILLERVEGTVKILEDYEEEVDRILPTDGKGAGGVSDGI